MLIFNPSQVSITVGDPEKCAVGETDIAVGETDVLRSVLQQLGNLLFQMLLEKRTSDVWFYNSREMKMFDDDDAWCDDDGDSDWEFFIFINWKTS